MVDFNAAIKANGVPVNGVRAFPDDVLVSNVMIYNTVTRETRNPVTAIDVVGGRRWQITDSFLADYGRLDGKASYQGFLKGNSKDGLMARNLAICHWRHSSPGRVGLSLGGGGTVDVELCEDRNCDVEHVNGRVFGNIVANCPSEPGLYLNASTNSQVSGNLFFNTTGIQLHTQFASADIYGNIMNGGVRDREGSVHTANYNEVYGIGYGAFFPAVSAYVQRRLDGQDKKFPSLISPGMVAAAQSTVAWIFDVLIGPPLGLGQWSMDGIVVDRASLNFALISPGDFSQSGLKFDQVHTDFCGRPRDGDGTAGPFISEQVPCDVSARIQRVLNLEAAYPVR